MTHTVLLQSFIPGALAAAVKQLGPQFEQATGYKLAITGATAGALLKRIQDGETADLAILAGTAAVDLAKQGKLDPASVVVIASAGLGVAVRVGAPKPDIRSVAAFKQALLSAKSVAYSDPADGASSGIHFAQVLQRLGLADELRPKTTLVRIGGSVGALVASGEVELAVQMESELLAAEGVELVGPLPQELQKLTIFSAAVFSGSQNTTAANSFIQFLASAEAAPVLKAIGLQPMAPVVKGANL